MSCRLFEECLLFVLLLRVCCVFVFVRGCSLCAVRLLLFVACFVLVVGGWLLVGVVSCCCCCFFLLFVSVCWLRGCIIHVLLCDECRVCCSLRAKVF